MAKLPPEIAKLFAPRRNLDGPPPSEYLALLKAFLRIKDASLRQSIINIVENIATAEPQE